MHTLLVQCSCVKEGTEFKLLPQTTNHKHPDWCKLSWWSATLCR